MLNLVLSNNITNKSSSETKYQESYICNQYKLTSLKEIRYKQYFRQVFETIVILMVALGWLAGIQSVFAPACLIYLWLPDL